MYASGGKNKSWKKGKERKRKPLMWLHHILLLAAKGGGGDKIKCKIVWEVDFHMFFCFDQNHFWLVKILTHQLH